MFLFMKRKITTYAQVHSTQGQTDPSILFVRPTPGIIFICYTGTTLTNQNSIPEEIKSRVEVRKCLLSFGAESFVLQILSKNLKIKIYRTIILSVVLYGCETWSLTLREERKLRVSENMVLKRIFGPRRDGVMEEIA